MTGVSARTAVFGSFLVGLTALAASGQTPLTTALDFYDRGEHERSLAAADVERLTAGDLRLGAEQWIDAGDPSTRARRRDVAAAFAVDLAWSATRHAANRISPNVDPVSSRFDHDRVRLPDTKAWFVLAGWASALMPADGPVTEVERWWRLASLGVLQDGHAWSTLLDDDHLGRAKARLGGEPRLRIIEVVARAADELGTLRESNLDRPDILRDERLGSAVTRRIPQAIRAFEALRDDPSLGGEAEVRIGYLELRRRRWADALVRFERARGLTTEPFLLAVTGYLTGWTLEQLERPQDAMAAYERAHAISPDMRDLSTRYAALLFTSGRRTDAHDVLAAMHATDAPFELLTMFERGDARLAPGYLARLREALR